MNTAATTIAPATSLRGSGIGRRDRVFAGALGAFAAGFEESETGTSAFIGFSLATPESYSRELAGRSVKLVD
jgi:hypothetical protein